MAFEHREGDFLAIACQKIPVAGATGVIHRRMTPVVRSFRTGRAASFYIGLMRIYQPKGFRLALAGANHAIQRGQIFRFLNHFTRAAQNRFGRKLRERIEPQATRLIEQFIVFERAVILVVIIDAEQRKHLIDRINVRFAGRRALLPCMGAAARRISLPSCGR